MKKFAISTAIAGGLFAGLLGAAGAAHATTTTEIVTPPIPSAEVTLPFDTNAGLGPNGANASLPLGLGQASVDRDGITGSLPFDTKVGLDANGANASLPLGLGQASIALGGAQR